MTAPADTPLTPWAARLEAEFTAADARAIALARTLTREALNWRPRAETWSIGQCLDHLCAANDAYITPMAQALDGRTPSPVDAITPGWFGAWFIRNYIEPSEKTKRAGAPKMIVPAQDVDVTVLDRFLAGNQQARELVRRASAYDVNRIRFPNPFVPLLRFTVGTGLEILSRHERRHLLQAERVRDARTA